MYKIFIPVLLLACLFGACSKPKTVPVPMPPPQADDRDTVVGKYYGTMVRYFEQLDTSGTMKREDSVYSAHCEITPVGKDSIMLRIFPGNEKWTTVYLKGVNQYSGGFHHGGEGVTFYPANDSMRYFWFKGAFSTIANGVIFTGKK